MGPPHHFCPGDLHRGFSRLNPFDGFEKSPSAKLLPTLKKIFFSHPGDRKIFSSAPSRALRASVGSVGPDWGDLNERERNRTKDQDTVAPPFPPHYAAKLHIFAEGYQIFFWATPKARRKQHKKNAGIKTKIRRLLAKPPYSSPRLARSQGG